MKKNIFFTAIAVSVFLAFLNCSGTASDEGDSDATYAVLTSNGSLEKLIGKPFTFAIKDNLGHDVTQESKIYVDGKLISGNSYTPVSKGSYQVAAQYRNLPVHPILITAVVNEGVSFKHRILYEDFTGTWCGYCTVASARYDHLKLQTDDFVFIGVHGPAGTTDPWSNEASTQLEAFSNVYEWPSMFINRTQNWLYNANYTDMSLPLSQLKAYSKIGIRMSSSVSGNTASITAHIFFTNDFQHLKIAAFIAEDQLVYPQKNYISTLYGGNTDISNYTHHNVLRHVLTSSVAGDLIPDSQATVSSEYGKSFNYTVPAGYHKDQLKVIIMILANDGTVLNVREELLNKNNNYEFI